METRKALLKGKDYITTEEYSEAEIEILLDVSADLKRKFKGRVPHRYLVDQTIFLMFFDKSTRTRNSFEAGITQLGGHAHFLTSDAMQVSHGESAKDTGIILSSYGHAIAIRHDLIPGEGNAYMREVASWADAPVINMQCDVDHPCQTLADLMTIREKLGSNLRGRKLAISWAYAPSYAKPLSVPQSLIMLMPRFGMDVVLAHPPEYGLMPQTMRRQERTRGAPEPSSRSWTTWTTRSATLTSSFPRVGAASTPWAPTPRNPCASPKDTRTGSATASAWNWPRNMLLHASATRGSRQRSDG